MSIKQGSLVKLTKEAHRNRGRAGVTGARPVLLVSAVTGNFFNATQITGTLQGKPFMSEPLEDYELIAESVELKIKQPNDEFNVGDWVKSGKHVVCVTSLSNLEFNGLFSGVVISAPADGREYVGMYGDHFPACEYALFKRWQEHKAARWERGSDAISQGLHERIKTHNMTSRALGSKKF